MGWGFSLPSFVPRPPTPSQVIAAPVAAIAAPVAIAKKVTPSVSTLKSRASNLNRQAKKGAALVNSIHTAPMRQAKGITLAARNGGGLSAMRHAGGQVQVGNTKLLKVGQIAGAVVATYATAGVAGAAVGVAGAGTAAATGMAVAGAGQLATAGYLDSGGLAKAGLITAGGSILSGTIKGYDTYKAVKDLRDARDALKAKQQAQALNEAEAAELAQLERDLAIEQQKAAQMQKASDAGLVVVDNAPPAPRSFGERWSAAVAEFRSYMNRG